MNKNKELEQFYDLIEAYKLLNEVIRSPYKTGYIGIISKLAPGSKEIINLKLLDFRYEIDREVRRLIKKILRKIGINRLPDGSR